MNNVELYLISDVNLEILNVYRPSNYQVNLDEETNSKSNFTIPLSSGTKKYQYLFLKGLYRPFYFVVDEVQTSKGKMYVDILAKDIINIFNRKVVLKKSEIIDNTSLEEFIKITIEDNFINSDDKILNVPYMIVDKKTDTKVKQSFNDDDGVYNFHTFIINCRQNHNIYTDIVIENNQLKITIEKRDESPVLIDTTVSEVSNYNKVYETDIVSKVSVYIRENDKEMNYYLCNNRTITTDINDINRAFGKINVISVETEDKSYEEALKIFQSNKYQHLVEFDIKKDSKLVDTNQLTIGRPIIVKTDSIYESYISSITISNSDTNIKYKSGNIRINLLDKLRVKSFSPGNKLDKTGGNITGNLLLNGNVICSFKTVEDI